MILTDLKTRKKRLVLAYRDIRPPPAEQTSQGGAVIPAPRNQGAASAPAAPPARSAVAKAIVVTVDNLPRKTFAMRLSPLKPVGGLLATTGREASLAIAPENAARYAPWVALHEKVDAARLVALYARAYPLFQQAYVELGYPDGHFNTRLVQVIDHLLAAQEPAAPVRLVVPKVLWKKGENDLCLDFAWVEAPKDRIPGSDDERTLPAAVDWLEILPPPATLARP